MPGAWAGPLADLIDEMPSPAVSAQEDVLKQISESMKTRLAVLSVVTFVLAMLGASCPLAEAQIDNPIVSHSCSGAGVSACTNAATTTVGGVDLIDLTINGVCASGYKPSTEQYAYTDRCTHIYTLLIIGYTENDEVEDDCGGIDIIGEVDAEASIAPVGDAPIATTYSGEDCEGAAFESSPGSVLGAPC
jgi:hypothetical protein